MQKQKYSSNAPPRSLQPYPELTLVDVVAENARLRPSHPAVWFHGQTLSWHDLVEAAGAFAAGLAEMGIAKGDRVALVLPNCPQFLICQLGAWQVGAIVVPINPMYTARELAHACVETGVTVAVVLSSVYENLKTIRAQTQLEHIIVTNIKLYLPWWPRLLFTLFKERQEGHRITPAGGDRWLSDILRRFSGQRTNATRPAPADPALLMFTGGTTGRPKAALSTHQALVMSGMQILAWFAEVADPWRDSNLLLMPLFHTYGNIGTLSVALIGRQRMVLIPDPRDIDSLLRTIDRVRPSYLCGVPTLFTALLNHPRVKSESVDFTSFKICISGAAPLLATTKANFEALTQGRLLEGYALTESVMAAVLTPIHGQTPAGAVGLPLPDVTIQIADSESRTALAPGQIGEILIRAPQLMTGYWQRPEATAATLRDGWLRTGDMGCVDDAGFLYISDRMKDLIKPSGFQVWPREVEEVIAAHPDVVEVGVAGVPDPYQGESVKAWVVAVPGAAVTAESLRAYCREQLAAYKVPRHIEFRSDLPKSTVGKVLRRALVEAEGQLPNAVE